MTEFSRQALEVAEKLNDMLDTVNRRWGYDAAVAAKAYAQAINHLVGIISLQQKLLESVENSEPAQKLTVTCAEHIEQSLLRLLRLAVLPHIPGNEQEDYLRSVRSICEAPIRDFQAFHNRRAK